MKLGILFAFSIVVLLLAASVSASSISRSLPKTVVAPGETITVVLNVVVDNGEWYIVDEIIPTGFVASNPGGVGEGSTQDTGHVKYHVLMNSENTQLTYDLTAPQETGTYSFAGVYGMQGVDGLLDIGGQGQITVAPPGDYTLVGAAAIIVIIILVIIFLKVRKK
jgi:hypothetical protein